MERHEGRLSEREKEMDYKFTLANVGRGSSFSFSPVVGAGEASGLSIVHGGNGSQLLGHAAKAR